MIRNPSDKILESLSALVDNEASEIEQHRILKNFGTDTELRDRWRRYHVIGSVMRREHNIASHIDVSAAVAAAIAGDAPSQGQVMAGDGRVADSAVVQGANVAPQQRGRWQVLLGKTAVAASFAAVMVLGINQFSGMDGADPASVQVADAAALPRMAESNALSAPLGFDIPAPAARTVSNNPMSYSDPSNPVPRILMPSASDDLTDPATQAMLNRLLIEHAARSSVNGSMGILPFARVSKMDEEISR